MNSIKRFLFFFLMTFSLIPVYSQVKNIGLPEIRNYKKTDYKGGTQNWNIDQDKNGNLYFANNNGLFQYDGATWKKFTLPNASAVRSVKIDSSGKIYVGGYDEFGYFKANSKGKLEYFSISKLANKVHIKRIDFIWKIHIHKGEVFFQSFDRVYIFGKGKLKVLAAPNRFQFSFQVKNELYFQDIIAGILQYKNGNLQPLKGTTALNKTEIWGMFPLSNHRILIATLDKGLFIYENEKVTVWDKEANSFIKKNSSLGGVMIKNSFIVLNSVLDGIIICDLNGQIIQHINHKQGLQNNTILTSFIDNKNNLWLGLDNGIAFVNENSPFTFFGFSYDLSTVYATTIFQGNLYVATNQGLFYHPWNASFKDDNFKLVEGTTGQTWNIQVIDNQLICSHNRGALVISNGKVTQTLNSMGCFALKTIPTKPNFFIGCTYNGFTVFEKTKTGITYKHQIEGFNLSAKTYELDENNLWLKKDNLLYQLTLSDDLKRFKTIKSFQNLSNSNKGIGSLQYLKGKVYFQNNNRFYRFSKDQNLFFEDKELGINFKNIPKIESLTEDQFGNIWYFFEESIGVLWKQKNGSYQNEMATFSNLSGNLVPNYISVNAISPEDIIIGLTDGLAHYNPNSPNYSASKPKAFIRSFSYPGDTIITGNSSDKTNSYTIPYASNRVKFTFSSPIYENSDKIVFSYKLEGFDEKWSNWSSVGIKEYTNLREGKYEMKLKVRNSHGIQSDVATQDFAISPPWYRHISAYFIYILLIIGCVILILDRIKIKIRKNKYYETIEQRRLYLEKESRIRQEQHDLEKEIEKLKNDKLQIQILSKDKELVNNSLQVVKKNKILNGIIHKLKDIDTESFDEATKFQFTKLNKSIVKEVNADKSWKDLEKHIKNVHFEFLKRLKEKYPTISPRELDLSTYLLMNMSTKEIAEIMNISTGGVELARYRLRKKLRLNKKENLTGFLMSI